MAFADNICVIGTKPMETETFMYCNKNLHHEGKTRGDYAVNALAVALDLTWEEVFFQLVGQAHILCKMPDDESCIRAVMTTNGFEKQTYMEEHIPVDYICKYMNENCFLGEVAIVKRDWAKGLAAILPIQGKDGKIRYKLCDTEYDPAFTVTHVWFRWPEGKKHSSKSFHHHASKTRKAYVPIPEDTRSFRYYQANPADNKVGDCVVRALAAVCNMNWHRVVDELAGYAKVGFSAINDQYVFRSFLVERGFTFHLRPEIVGYSMTGAEFCTRMTRDYHNGERILAALGSSHVAAVLPCTDEIGCTQYKIIDNWNSTNRRVCWYWVLKNDEAA